MAESRLSKLSFGEARFDARSTDTGSLLLNLLPDRFQTVWHGARDRFGISQILGIFEQCRLKPNT